MSWDGCSQRREFWGGGPVSKDAAYGAVRGSIGTGSLYDEGTDSEKVCAFSSALSGITRTTPGQV